ncbi:hypothetical protein [Bradyrhizobium sp. CCGUVB23]|uniref:hypothetical protein n=1 Tax=Bradyrhizobium sp. CCGUVB23 TaxID=2949630 RepID=UPI0020B18E54|nr:hypothetical protein [Bradyrhizobium sp. CCGUVB23]MCP3468691.1 hypothetical protein [Bradyrhizobium sp. CCGUVB23]
MTMTKKPQIGQRQASRICQLSAADRLAFIAEGLPIIHASAKGFWSASAELREKPREAEVLAGFAKEEAAKILILLDIVRCPEKRIAGKVNKLVARFYGHLERLIYAQLSDWWSIDVADLRKAVAPLRKVHDLEGNMGEFIMPNSTLYQRESKLYADVEAYEDGTPIWNAPVGHQSYYPARMPSVVQVVNAMAACGMFTVEGLQATSEVWGRLEFQEKETLQDAERLTEQLLARLIAESLPDESATQDHVNVLYRHWPLPMYNVDLHPIPVSLEELKAEQDRLYWAEVGDPR